MKFVHFSLLLFSLFGVAHAASLPASVKTALRQAHIPLNSVGIEVRAVDSHKPLISVNAQRPMNPASTMKLLTTYASLELLGPAYTWKTEAWLDGKLDNGVLQGDLILKGFGDPDLTIEQFWLWLSEMRNRGLREIRGDLVLDRSAFQLPTADPAEFDDDPERAYNVEPDALLLNFNALRLRYIPEGEKVTVITEPDLANTTLVNHLVATTQDNCSGWKSAVSPQMSGKVLLLQGSFPANCGEREQYLSLLPHSEYLYDVFSTLWQQLGGKLDGSLRDGSVPDDATLFSTHLSAPLSEQIRNINKFSNNVMARQLFLTLSLDDKPPATITRSKQIIRDWLAHKGLDFPELVMDNGAGLSRTSRISAQSMSLLLLAARRSSFQPELESSLPIIGVDGTLKKRLFDNPTTGHAHLKTGTLTGVKTEAGYVQDRNGKQWVVVFFINHPNAVRGQAAQDALIEWLQQR